jgi:hypothetical protein
LEVNLKQLLGTELKKKTIVTIRHVNKKFDDLTFDQQLSFICMNNLKDFLVELMQTTLKRFEGNGRPYILSNPWTVQILDYLMQYYRYVCDILKSSEESRVIALAEEVKDRSELVEDFAKSTLGS